MKKPALSIAAAALLAGCGATQPRVVMQRVYVEVPIECRERAPDRPVMPTEHLPEGVGTDAWVQAGQAEIELTYNWGSQEDYGSARNFGHLAFRVADIHAVCAHLQALGYAIHRPPRDGHMAFVRSPDLISIELLQAGDPLPPQEPWASMPNSGTW